MGAIDAIAALLARDLRGFFRSRSQLYSSIFFPLMLLLVLGTGVAEGLDPRNVSDYRAFLTPGLIVMTALFSSTFSSATYYQDRDSGILRVFYASPHSQRVVLLGKSLSSVLIGGLQALIVLLVAAVIPAIDFQWQYGLIGSVLTALAAVALLNFFLAGLGQLLASRIHSMNGFHLVMNLVLFPLLFFSGAFFPLDSLPEWLKLVGRVNPLSYGVDSLQLAMYADGSRGYFGLPMDFAVLASLAAGVFYLGTAPRKGSA